MDSWDLPEPPSELLYYADVEGYTKNTADWRFHGAFSSIPGTIKCTHRGLREPTEVRMKRVELDTKEICWIGRCEVCGMVHWAISK